MKPNALRRWTAASPFAVAGGTLALMVVLVESLYLLSPAKPMMKSYPSPDGKWQVEIGKIVMECTQGERERLGPFRESVTLRDTSDGSAREVDKYDDTDCHETPWVGYDAITWTSDSRYFYYSFGMRDHPGINPGYAAPSLRRLDVQGSLEGGTLLGELGPGLRSLDGSRFATWLSSEPAIEVRDFERGDQTFRLPAAEAGGYEAAIAWSPDSEVLVYLQHESRDYRSPSVLVLVDVAKQTQTVLVRTDEPSFAGVAWEAPGKITLFERTWYGTAGRNWSYDLASSELRLAAPIAARVLFTVAFVPFTLVVGHLLRSRGRIFLEQVFSGETRPASAANLLLNVGFYMLCTGLLLWNIGLPSNQGSFIGAVQETAARLGQCMMVVAVLHGLNVLVLSLLSRRSRSADDHAHSGDATRLPSPERSSTTPARIEPPSEVREGGPRRATTARRAILASPLARLGALMTLLIVVLFSAYLLAWLPGKPKTKSYSSPDGKWQVEIVNGVCSYDNFEGERMGWFTDTLSLRNVSDGSTTEVEGFPQDCEERSWFGLNGLFWTQDSSFFYYSNSIHDPGDNEDGSWHPGLSRIDVRPSTEYCSSCPEYLGSAWLSPDGTKFATWLDPEGQLGIHDIEQGELLRFAAPEEGAYDPILAWSPDSTALVYLQSMGWTHTATLVLVDLPGQSQTVLVQTNETRFVDLAWDVPSEIRLVEAANGTFDTEWRYDLDSGELKLAP